MSRKRAMGFANVGMALLAWIPLLANLHMAWGYAVVIVVDLFIQTAMYWDQLGHNASVKFLTPSEQVARVEGLLQSIPSLGFAGGMIVMFLTTGHGPSCWLLAIIEGGFVIMALITWVFLPQDPSPFKDTQRLHPGPPKHDVQHTQK